MNFSLEALYALHMISNNGFSEEIFLLPLPEIAEEEKLKQLKQVLEQGYEDLRNMGLIDENNDPTTACMARGIYLEQYQKAFSHCEIDQHFYCAQLVDSNRWYHIVIEKVGDNAYTVNRIHSFHFLGMTIQLHDFLSDQNPSRDVNPLASSWRRYSDERLLIYYGNKPALNVLTYSGKKKTTAYLYLEAPSGIYQYDMLEERIRSVSTGEMEKEIIKQLKVRIEPCQRLVFP
ncbi:MAG: hypothetical protein JTJ17_12995 [Streptococcus gordonii]|nr:hypothetical protein [Streptococcus gordonii]